MLLRKGITAGPSTNKGAVSEQQNNSPMAWKKLTIRWLEGSFSITRNLQDFPRQSDMTEFEWVYLRTDIELLYRKISYLGLSVLTER